MQIKRKPKEPDIVEQRDLNIVRFVLFALVPLLISFLMGFGLGKSEDTSSNNRTENRAKKDDDIGLKEAKIKAMTTEMEQLKQLFQVLDSLHEKHKSDWEVSGNATPSQGAGEKAVSKWEGKWKGNAEEFLGEIKSKGNSWQSKELETEHIVKSGINWLQEFSLAKRDEFIEMKSQLFMEQNPDEDKEEKTCCKKLEKKEMEEEFRNQIPPQTNSDDILQQIEQEKQQKRIQEQDVRIEKLTAQARQIGEKLQGNLDVIQDNIKGLDDKVRFIGGGCRTEIGTFKNEVGSELTSMKIEISKLSNQ